MGIQLNKIEANTIVLPRLPLLNKDTIHSYLCSCSTFDNPHEKPLLHLIGHHVALIWRVLYGFHHIFVVRVNERVEQKVCHTTNGVLFVRHSRLEFQ